MQQIRYRGDAPIGSCGWKWSPSGGIVTAHTAQSCLSRQDRPRRRPPRWQARSDRGRASLHRRAKAPRQARGRVSHDQAHDIRIPPQWEGRCHSCRSFVGAGAHGRNGYYRYDICRRTGGRCHAKTGLELLAAHRSPSTSSPTRRRRLRPTSHTARSLWCSSRLGWDTARGNGAPKELRRSSASLGYRLVDRGCRRRCPRSGSHHQWWRRACSLATHADRLQGIARAAAVAPRSPTLRGPGHPLVDRNQKHAIHLRTLMIEPAGSSGRTGADYQAHLALVYSSERRACKGDGGAKPKRGSATRATGSTPPTGLLKTSLKSDRSGDDRYASDEGQDVGRSLSRANSRECPGHNEH